MLIWDEAARVSFVVFICRGFQQILFYNDCFVMIEGVAAHASIGENDGRLSLRVRRLRACGCFLIPNGPIVNLSIVRLMVAVKHVRDGHEITEKMVDDFYHATRIHA